MKEPVLKLDPSRPYQVEGTLLAIWLPRGRGKEDTAHGLVASITGCPNPACPCVKMVLSVLPVDDCDIKVVVTSTSMKIERLGAPASVAPSVRYLSLDMFTAVVLSKGGGDLPDDLQPFFREPLPGWVLDHICEIWIGLRPKLQSDWKTQALAHWRPGELLSRLVAFPERRFDRYVVDGKTYQMDTLFCVEIDCDCAEAEFVLMEVRDQALIEVAAARVPVATMIPQNIRTSGCPKQLFIRVYLDLPSIRLIPFAPLAFAGKPAEGRVVDRRRSLLTALWFSGGLAIAGAGFVLSARIGTEAFLDPILAGSPVAFIVGLVVLATTGAVYELLPENK